jgi:hypothetical protein
VLTLVDPDAFERSLLGWVRTVFRPGGDGRGNARDQGLKLGDLTG